MNTINTAVILAAGLGSRLKDKTKDKPKGFLQIDGLSLIERSMHNLIKAGITRVFIGTGYLADFFEKFSTHYDHISCVKNEIFATSGSMYTLFNIRDHINADFLLLEADLLYEKRGLQLLTADENADVILASGKTNSGDEVYIQADGNGDLVKMSKKAEDLGNIYVELVGISKISLPAYKKMCDFAFEEFKTNLMLDYEYTMVGISKDRKFKVLKVDDLAWCEIDDENHYQRAVQKIYPWIKEKETEMSH